MKEDGGLAHNARFEGVDRAAVTQKKVYARRISGRKARARRVPGSKLCYIYIYDGMLWDISPL